MPGYEPTACLAALYSRQFSETSPPVSSRVDARAFHQKLYNDEELYRTLYGQHTITATNKTKMHNQCNIAVGEVTVLYSEVPVSEGLPDSLELEKMPIRYNSDLNHVSFSMSDFSRGETYVVPHIKAGLRHEPLNIQLREHLNFALNIAPLHTLHAKEKTKIKRDIDLAIEQGDFHQVFHHSEQCLMYCCRSKDFTDQIVEKLREVDAATFAGIVIDIYSTRLMCNNCAYHMVGFSHAYSGILIDEIKDSELEIKFPLQNNLLVHPRVSARYSCSTNDGTTITAMNDRNIVHQYEENESPLPLQSTVSKMRLTQYEGQQFATKSDFFLSGNLRDDSLDQKIIRSRNRGLRD